MTPTDRTTATDAEFVARFAPFDPALTAPVLPEGMREAAWQDFDRRAEHLRRWYHAEVCEYLPEGGINCDDLMQAALAVFRDQQDGAVLAVLALADRFDAAATPPAIGEFDRGVAATYADAARSIRIVVGGEDDDPRQAADRIRTAIGSVTT